MRLCGFAVSILFFLLHCTNLLAQKRITVEDFSTNSTFQHRSVTGINWMRDGKFYTSLADNRILKYSITSGDVVDTVFDARIFPSLEIKSYSLSNGEDKVLIASEVKTIYRRSYVAEYFVFDIPTKNLRKLSPNGKQQYATFSPDGSKVAFVRSNNLFYVALDNMNEVQITNDGEFNRFINGTTDWVYEEEFGFVDAFYWSPDSKRLAYYRFDETEVKEYNMQIWGKKLYPIDYKFKYPKAGETISKVEIWIFSLADQSKVKADLGGDTEFYVPRVKWTSSAEVLSVRKMNRLQNEQQILHVSAADGTAKKIVEEKSSTYIDAEYVDDLYYMSDGKHFVYASEESGFKHLYLYSIDGVRIRQLTSGQFEVVSFVGLDERSRLLYYVSTEPSPLDRQFLFNTAGWKEKDQALAG